MRRTDHQCPTSSFLDNFIVTSFSKFKGLEFGAVRFHASHRSREPNTASYSILFPAHKWAAFQETRIAVGRKSVGCYRARESVFLKNLFRTQLFGSLKREVFWMRSKCCSRVIGPSQRNRSPLTIMRANCWGVATWCWVHPLSAIV